MGRSHHHTGPCCAAVEADPADWSTARRYHFLTSAVAPRPIAWVTTVDREGVANAAPFSWFQAVCADPPMVMLAIAHRSDGTEKDTLRNIRDTKEFVVNAANEAMLEPMVATSADLPSGTSELEANGIATTESTAVAPPRIADAPFHLECRLVDIHAYGGAKGTHVVIGEVVHIHADDAHLDDRGSFKPHDAHLLARLGGNDYLAVRDVFGYKRPVNDDAGR